MAAGTGVSNNFYFDPVVFSNYTQEKPKYNNAILASGIVENDNTIASLIGTKGNIGSMPFYKPLDLDTYAVLNNDGATSNTPAAVTGGKQTFMGIKRMKAFKDEDFTRELSGANPLQDVANKVLDYNRQVRQADLLAILGGVSAISGFSSTHTTDVSITTGTITDANKISDASGIELMAKACGDLAGGFSLVVMHSAVFARLRALQLINYTKYTIPDGLRDGVELPTYNGMIVWVCDRGLVDTTTPGYPIYTTYFVGKGLFRGAEMATEKPIYTAFDPETNGGVNKLYVHQDYVLHPNGFSIAYANISKDSPTTAELGTTANWSLAFDAKVIPLASLKTNG